MKEERGSTRYICLIDLFLDGRKHSIFTIRVQSKKVVKMRAKPITFVNCGTSIFYES